MGTRSRIGMEFPDGKIRSIYCHWDGYPEHHGPILLENYRTPEEISKLLERGDLSSLSHNPVVCVAYRDRGENDVDATDHDDITDFQSYSEEYNYLFRDNEWWVEGYGDDNEGSFQKLAPLLIQITKELEEEQNNVD